MEHLVIEFKHDIKDLIPYCKFIERIKNDLLTKNIEKYLGDDMAIDGGDAEAIFSCQNAKLFFEKIKSELVAQSFMSGAKVSLVFGELESNAKIEVHFL